MRQNNFHIQKFIDEMEHQNISIAEGLEQFYPGMVEEDLTTEDHTTWDDQLFMCDSCGCWLSTSERCSTNGNGDVCNDCKDNEDDEEGED